MNAIPEALPARRARPPISLWLVALLLAFVAWRVLSLGLADHFAGRDPEAALRWRSSHPEALLAAAADADGVEAERFARRAIAAAPLEGAGYRRLAEMAVAAGDAEQALTLYSIAARLSPRDEAAHAWLFDHHIARGNVPEALLHLDALLRLEPTMVGPAMPVLVGLAQSPQTEAALAERLATRPPWRRAVLRALPEAATDIDAIVPFFDRLGRAHVFEENDFEYWLTRLGKDGRWGDAYLDWVGLLPPERRDGLGNVADGGFEVPPDQGGFGWRFGRVAGARIDRVPAPGRENSKALRVAFEHRRVPFEHVRQLLALPPGQWRLTGQARLENLRTERGLVWTVSCAAPSRGRLGETPPLRGHGDWREFSVEFAVPEEGCPGQWLILRLPARIPAEQRIGGQVWFDDLRITRIQ